MKADNFFKYGAPLYQPKSTRSHSHLQNQPQAHTGNIGHLTSSSLLTSDDLRHLTQQRSTGYSDRESIASVSSAGGRIKRRSRNFPMKSSKGGISKKSKTMDYTNYAYNEAVGRLKVMLADNSYVAPKLGGGVSSYLRNFNEDSGDNFSDNLSVIERPVFSDISKYLSPSQKSRITSYRPKKNYTSGYLSASKENLASTPALYPSTSVPAAPLPADSVPAPVEIFSFIEKQEDYIEQLEKESKYCRNELTNLLGKVKDVINENEQLTENARSELVALGSGKTQPPINTTSPSSDSDEHLVFASGRKTPSTPRKSACKGQVQSPRYASAPNIVYEARISELEAELMQASIDLRRLRTENEELKRKLAHTDPLSTVATLTGGSNCDLHRKQLESLQQDKATLEESVRHLQRLLDEAKAQSQGSASSKRYISDLVQMERSQAELEVRHLRDELDRQHERVRELQHEMARRLAEERASAERRYNSQVDQLGGDLSCQWEQVAKLQLDLERQKRYETDLKRDVASRNSQIEELKMELRANRTTFLADMAQVNAEKQSLEQDITSLRLQLDRAARETKTEAARLTAEINSLRQRLDRGDADLLHSKREVLRLNDEIANLEKELAYGELKNEIRPTKKDLDKRISEMQDKHEPICDLAMPTTTTTSEPLTTTTISAPTTIKESANEFILLPDLELTDFTEDVVAAADVAATTADVAAVDAGDEILQNIIRSNERLAKELAKMPPLPKISSYKKPRSRTEISAPTAAVATPATAATSKTKCFCPSFMRHRHEHEHIHTLRRRSSSSISHSETSAACCRSRNGNRPTATSAATAATSASKARTQTMHSKSMQCHGHEPTLDTHHQHEHHRTASNITAEQQHHPGCCHPCKTEPLPWLQQHLVLNQTLSSTTACQPTCQVQHLTVDAGGMAATSADATSPACRGPGSNALSASIKPKVYFEQLLRRDGCHKKPRPPVKVDVNVRLVPKQPKQPKVTHSLNETFIKEVDEVAQALNETFVKETSPELAQIDEQLAELENDREQEDHDEEDEEQEQATKL
ncbi:uncharacterized protein LOC108116436 isoform X3 [Drosophila eugracilis]|uniref:uncharacterized protein LOC108116436 isoform X3 n=1 Tax=Drosophila eugracilis TaxID=29029 RepID=UPI001BDA368F|nr:uncharacterized protein LOC108116436 isoform X3 [Drosophila eugracilis]XP_017083828.2 uncharacterized protein LOC108116436 isoform X3 [Drosophila eugracilis]